MGAGLGAAFAASVWLPVWISSIALRITGSHGLTLLVTGAIGILFILLMTLFNKEMSDWWQSWINIIIENNFSGAEMMQIQEVMDGILPLISGIIGGGDCYQSDNYGVIGTLLAICLIQSRWIPRGILSLTVTKMVHIVNLYLPAHKFTGHGGYFLAVQKYFRNIDRNACVSGDSEYASGCIQSQAFKELVVCNVFFSIYTATVIYISGNFWYGRYP